MADIYEFVNKTNDSRPVYTSYELSKMVRKKRKSSNLDIAAFAEKYGIAEKMLKEIETGLCSFTPQMYHSCGNILGLSAEELLAETSDNLEAANFRVNGAQEGIQSTFEKADMLFQEMIMQKKIGVR